MNLEFLVVRARDYSKLIPRLICVLTLSLLVASCFKKPAELQESGMKAFAAREYAKAQEYFADGIKKEGNTQLYAGFIAANLVTGKYPEVNSAYNEFSDNIHSSLTELYGERVIRTLGVTTELIPYNIKGGNQIPPDFPQTIALQASADYSAYLTVEQQIDDIVKK